MRRRGGHVRLSAHAVARWRQYRPRDSRCAMARAVVAALHGTMSGTAAGAFEARAGTMTVVLALEVAGWVALTAYPTREKGSEAG